MKELLYAINDTLVQREASPQNEKTVAINIYRLETSLRKEEKNSKNKNE